MKISVALCTYNGARFIEEQLNSIAQQERLPDELVICDDCSKDETLAIVGRFAAKCEFEVRIEKNAKNLGSTRNFEQAVSLCRGEIIALADQDDRWSPNKLGRMDQLFEEHPEIGFAFSDASMIDEEGRLLPHGLWESLPFDGRMRRRMDENHGFETLVQRNVVTGACMAFRASYRDMLLPIPETWVHDGWIALLLAAVSPFIAVDEQLVEYRRHFRQQIGAKKENLYGQLLRGMRQQRADFEKVSKNYADAKNRLAQFNLRLRNADYLRLLDEKSAHFFAKAKMRTPKTWRLPIILGELMHRHYGRYSRGWKSMAQDLFL
jgi:glycosyltransferase involved in cell wall biosynthesis